MTGTDEDVYEPLECLARLYKVQIIIPKKPKVHKTPSIILTSTSGRERAISLPEMVQDSKTGPTEKKKKKKKKKSKKKKRKKASKGKRSEKKRNSSKRKRTGPREKPRLFKAQSDSIVGRHSRTRSAGAFKPSKYIVHPPHSKRVSAQPSIPKVTKPVINKAFISSNSFTFGAKNDESPRETSRSRPIESTISQLSFASPKNKDTLFEFPNEDPSNDALVQFHSFVSDLSVADDCFGLDDEDMSTLIRDYQSFADKNFKVDPDGIKRLQSIVERVDVPSDSNLPASRKKKLKLLKTKSIEKLDKLVMLAHRYNMHTWMDNDDSMESSEYISKKRADYDADLDSDETSTGGYLG